MRFNVIIGRMEKKLPQGLTIRIEQPQDIKGIRRVNRAAFDGDYEAEVVDRLRLNCPTMLSLVVSDGKNIVGHIMFSPAQIVQDEGWTISGMGLGPLAVLPSNQGMGIGSALCQEGLQRMEIAGYPFVVVLGHPGYYPRFGFEKASTHGVKSAFEDVPEEAFMIRIFDKEAMAGVKGIAYYRPEFNSTN